MSVMNQKRLRAYISGAVDQELRLRNECLAAEIKMLRAQIQGRPRFPDPQPKALAEIAQRL